VVYGSFEVLEQVLKMTGASVPLFLNDKDGGSWAAEWPAPLKEIVGAERVLPVRSKKLFASYMEDVLMAASQRCGNFCLMIYGNPSASLLRYCGETFSNVVVHGNLPADLRENVPENCWQMADFSDRMHFDLGIGIALLLCPPSAGDAMSIDQLLLPEGIVITSGHYARFESDVPGRAVLRLDPNHAYRGQMDRWVAIANLMKAAQPSPLAMQ
jgi:hypothetical protein